MSLSDFQQCLAKEEQQKWSLLMFCFYSESKCIAYYPFLLFPFSYCHHLTHIQLDFSCSASVCLIRRHAPREQDGNRVLSDTQLLPWQHPRFPSGLPTLVWTIWKLFSQKQVPIISQGRCDHICWQKVIWYWHTHLVVITRPAYLRICSFTARAKAHQRHTWGQAPFGIPPASPLSTPTPFLSQRER